MFMFVYYQFWSSFCTLIKSLRDLVFVFQTHAHCIVKSLIKIPGSLHNTLPITTEESKSSSLVGSRLLDLWYNMNCAWRKHCLQFVLLDINMVLHKYKYNSFRSDSISIFVVWVMVSKSVIIIKPFFHLKPLLGTQSYLLEFWSW